MPQGVGACSTIENSILRISICCCCLGLPNLGPKPILALAHIGHDQSGEHPGCVLEGHLGDLASPGAPKAIEAGRAQITSATLERNANLKKTHKFYGAFLRVRAPGDVIYSNLEVEGAPLRGIRRGSLGPYTKPPGPLQPKAVWGIIWVQCWTCLIQVRSCQPA